MIRPSVYSVVAPSLIVLTLIASGCEKKEEIVVPDEGPEIVRFAVSPLSVEVGQVAVLSWETTGATTVTVSPEGGEPLDLAGAEAAFGRVEVRPTAATRYLLVAADEAGRSVQRGATVAVSAAREPVAAFQVRDAKIDFGTSTELSWTTNRAARVTISAGDEVVYDGEQANGTLEVSPTMATEYRLVAIGPGGEASKTVKVDVTPVVKSFVTNATTGVVAGSKVFLRWETAGAESVVITSPDGYEHIVPPMERGQGEVAATVGTTGRFVLTATLGTHHVSKSVELTLETGPVIVEFSSTPRAVTVAGPVTLSWKAVNTTFVTIDADPGGYLVTQLHQQEGTFRAEISEDTSIRLIATGLDGGLAIARIEVKSLPEPAIESFVAVPSRVGRGEQVKLTWTTADAERAEIEVDGELLASDLPPNGSTTLPLQHDVTIVLRAFNGADFAVESAVDVTVGPPEVLSFERDVKKAHRGAPLRFSWTNLGGVSLQVMGPGGSMPGCTIADPAVIAAGSCTTPAPAVEGEVEFTLAVTNGVGDRVTASKKVEIREGPILHDFTADKARISSGDALMVSWTAEPDSSGTAATLVVEDDLGAVYPISNPASGVAIIHPSSPGMRTLTLTASTPGTVPDRAALGLEVRALPTVTLSASAPNYDPVAGIPVIVSWTTTGAASVSVYRLDASGNPVLPALREDTGTKASSGNMAVSPTGPTTYRAVVLNDLGGAGYDEIFVDAPEFQIVSFTATPATVSPGGSVTLAWQTINGTSVSIDTPQTMVMTTGTDPYIDITTSPTKQVVPTDFCNSSWDDEGCALVTFPNGFSFPFDGVSRTQARIYVNGIVSFDTSRTGATYPLMTTLPSTAQPWAHMSVFWKDLFVGSSGNMVYDTGSDSRGNYMIVQWPHFSSTDLNFEVLMWADGYFEYRYGLMSGGNGYAGYENMTGTAGVSIVSNGTIASNTSYRFSLPVLPPLQGSLAVQPTASRTYTLTANGAGGLRATRTVSVTVQ